MDGLCRLDLHERAVFLGRLGDLAAPEDVRSVVADRRRVDARRHEREEPDRDDEHRNREERSERHAIGRLLHRRRLLVGDGVAGALLIAKAPGEVRIGDRRFGVDAAFLRTACENEREDAGDGEKDRRRIEAHAELAERVEVEERNREHHRCRWERRERGDPVGLPLAFRRCIASDEEIEREREEEAVDPEREEADRDAAPEAIAKERRVGAIHRGLARVVALLDRREPGDERAVRLVELPVEVVCVVVRRERGEEHADAPLATRPRTPGATGLLAIAKRA